jgi:6-phosphogluconolactonase (cycloisomerase 2 family)
MRKSTQHRILINLLCTALAGCGGGGGGNNSSPPPPPPAPTSFSVGGTVSGLDAVGLVLQNNGGPDLAITANGAFAFPTQVASGAAYSVTIKAQPNIGPLQVCSLGNGSGTIASSAVTNVTITCVSRVFKFLYVTSTFTNDLRGYSINAVTGALTAVAGMPIPTGAAPTVPLSEPSGRFLYLTTRGSTVEPPRVEVYAADAATGVLTEIQASPYDLDTPPPAAGAPFVSAATIHPSGAFGYVAVPFPTSSLYGATINAATGELTEIPGMPIPVGVGMTGITFDSTGGFMFTATSLSGGGPGEIRSFLVNVPSGVLTPIGSFSTSGNSPAGVVFSPGGDYLLTTNVNSGTLVVFAVNKTAGTLTPVGTPISTGAAGSRPVGVVYNRRNDVFYVANVGGGPTSIAVFRFDRTTGVATAVGGNASVNGASAGVLLHSSGRYLFQYNSSTSSIQRFAIDQATGALTLAQDVTALAPGAQSIGMFSDVSGRYMYVTNPAATEVSSYAIDPATGALTLINSLPTSPGSLATVPFQLQ